MNEWALVWLALAVFVGICVGSYIRWRNRRDRWPDDD